LKTLTANGLNYPYLSGNASTTSILVDERVICHADSFEFAFRVAPELRPFCTGANGPNKSFCTASMKKPRTKK
jgi:hypothetical protein